MTSTCKLKAIEKLLWPIKKHHGGSLSSSECACYAIVIVSQMKNALDSTDEFVSQYYTIRRASSFQSHDVEFYDNDSGIIIPFHGAEIIFLRSIFNDEE